MESPADELLYGGAGGGGKTDSVIGIAVTRHRKAIIFRRQYEQLKDIIARSREIIGDRGRFNGQDNIWRLPARTLELGAVQHEHDKEKWKGRAHDFKGFDQLEDFTESQYLFLTAWARTTAPGQRVRVVATCNPPQTAEGEWIIQRWAAWLDGQHPHPAEPGELRWYAVLPGEDGETECGTSDPFAHKGEVVTPSSRTFIPARLSDNPYLDSDGRYRAKLQGQPEPRRSQLLYGDFTVGQTDDIWQCIPTDWVRKAQARWTPERPRHATGDPYRLQVVAVDPSEGGSDRFVLARRYGTWWPALEVHPGSLLGTLGLGEEMQERQLLERGGPLILRALQEGGEAMIDADGIGASLASWVSWKTGGRASSFRGSAKTSLSDRTERLAFVNLRAAAYWRMREWLDPELGHDLALPPGREVLAELCAPRYKMTTAGIQLEAKDEIKKRLGRSPDVGDALVMSLFSAPPPAPPRELRVSMG